MPVVPIIAAVGAWAATGAAAAAGAFITTGALTVAGALEITAAVGATLGAIGAVTGDKGLMTAGMVLGGIGGIGSLAVGAGLFGADAGATTLFGDAAVADSVAVTPEIAGSNVGGFMGDGSSIIDSLGGVSSSPVEVSPLPDVAGVSSSPTVAATDALSGSAAAPPPSPGAPAPASPSLAVPDATAAPASPASGLVPPVPSVSAPAVPGSVSITPGNDATSNPGGFAGPGPDPGIFDKLGSFVKNDKSGMIGYGLIQAGGSLIGGLFDPLKPAQVSALNAQTAQQQAQTGITTTQAANMKAPIPVASFRPQGLINTGAM